jgi:uncharacterized protein (UPF0218 family)
MGTLFEAAKVGKAPFLRAVGRSTVVITVGDRVTESFGKMGRVPDVQVVDALENRVKRRPPEVAFSRAIRVRNPAATITREAIEGVGDAIRGQKPARVLVDGEEDLLAIPAVVLAPMGAGVFYGQPGVGVVMVRVSAASKSRNRAILRRMGAPTAI